MDNAIELRCVTKRFLTPSGGRLLGEGLPPDLPVDADAAALAKGIDRQLEAALAILS